MTESTLQPLSASPIESTIDPLAPVPAGARIAGWLVAALVTFIVVGTALLLLWAGLDPHEPEWVDGFADFFALAWAQ